MTIWKRRETVEFVQQVHKLDKGMFTITNKDDLQSIIKILVLNKEQVVHYRQRKEVKHSSN